MQLVNSEGNNVHCRKDANQFPGCFIYSFFYQIFVITFCIKNVSKVLDRIFCSASIFISLTYRSGNVSFFFPFIIILQHLVSFSSSFFDLLKCYCFCVRWDFAIFSLMVFILAMSSTNVSGYIVTSPIWTPSSSSQNSPVDTLHICAPSAVPCCTVSVVLKYSVFPYGVLIWHFAFAFNL